MTTPSPEELLLVGRVVAPFGIQGLLKVRAITDKPEHLRRHINTVYVGPKLQEYQLRRVHIHKPGLLLVTLGGVETRDAADELRGSEIFIREAEAVPLAAEEYYLHQLYGLEVVTEAGEPVGQVREVIETGANEVLVVARRGRSDALIPMIHDAIEQVDIPSGRVVIKPLPGLLEG
jgi:16S rRNA processing protein RimM